MSLDGKVVIISGAGSGIGAATALRLAAEGASVVLTGRRAQNLADVAAAISAANSGSGVLTVTADVTKEADWTRVIGDTLAKFGRVDALFQNAGYEGTTKPLANTSADELRAVFDINILGVALAVKHAGPELVKTKGTLVVNSSCVSAFSRVGVPTDALAPYNATKAAVDAFVRSVHSHLSSHGVRVFTVNPWVYGTEMTTKIATSSVAQAFGISDITKMAWGFNPLGAPGDAADFGSLLTSILSGRTKYVSGDSIAAFPSHTAGKPFTANMDHFYKHTAANAPHQLSYATTPLADVDGVPLPPAELAAAQAEIGAHVDNVLKTMAAAAAASAATH